MFHSNFKKLNYNISKFIYLFILKIELMDNKNLKELQFLTPF